MLHLVRPRRMPAEARYRTDCMHILRQDLACAILCANKSKLRSGVGRKLVTYVKRLPCRSTSYTDAVAGSRRSSYHYKASNAPRSRGNAILRSFFCTWKFSEFTSAAGPIIWTPVSAGVGRVGSAGLRVAIMTRRISLDQLSSSQIVSSEMLGFPLGP